MNSFRPVDALSLRQWPLATVRRAARAMVLVSASTALGGCAVWNAIFSDPPPSVPVPTPPALADKAQPIAPQALPPSLPASAPAPAPAEPVAVASPVSMPAAPVATELTPPSPLPKAAAEAPAAKPAPANVVPNTPGFYINVGLFAVPTNGSNAVGILRGAGLPVFFDTVESKTKGSLTRVRVGPYAKKAEAQAAAKKIKGLKLDAVVYQHK
ncbi:SPOR domain-containing protein [Curvibacter sp. APW13]|uniref:SPOR domain-containing protein n=1 Tax=Curvibacter sp. APW13 TaxID=3077236 RepID=UPI0028DD572F|nr:SPOR domain-containing protein [Curvibacter sp. APW13]MDT8991977.1 SPOR domain-containing protein [Curvibacter sp. APW13]